MSMASRRSSTSGEIVALITRTCDCWRVFASVGAGETVLLNRYHLTLDADRFSEKGREQPDSGIQVKGSLARLRRKPVENRLDQGRRSPLVHLPEGARRSEMCGRAAKPPTVPRRRDGGRR